MTEAREKGQTKIEEEEREREREREKCLKS